MNMRKVIISVIQVRIYFQGFLFNFRKARREFFSRVNIYFLKGQGLLVLKLLMI